MEVKNQELLDAIIDRIKWELDYWHISYGEDEVHIDSDLYGIGLDNSDIRNILCEIEDWPVDEPIDIPLNVMTKFETIKEIYNHVLKEFDGLEWTPTRTC